MLGRLPEGKRGLYCLGVLAPRDPHGPEPAHFFAVTTLPRARVASPRWPRTAVAGVLP